MATPVRLVTPRLTLRPLEMADWPALYAFTGDAEVQRYVTGAPLGEEETRNLIVMLRDWEREQPPRAHPFAFAHTTDNVVIGFGGLYWTKGPERWQAELGYTLHRAYWGQGYASEAGAAILRFGFTALRLHRVFAECHPDNVGSARVMQRLGMRYEGRLREVEWSATGWWDMLHYAILDHEWYDRDRAQRAATP